MSMATKLGRMIACLDGLLPIMSNDPLITWSCEIQGLLTEKVQHANALVVTNFLSQFAGTSMI